MSNRKPGYIKIGAFGEASVLLHWSFLIGCIFVAIFFKAKLGELFFVCSAYAALIIFHEIGHAVAARVFSLKVYSIELSGLGGVCRAEIPGSRLAALVYASAGLIVQIILLIIVGTYINYSGWPTTVAGTSTAFVFTAVNSLLILVNLIPSKARHENYGSDGYFIWKLILQFFRGQPYCYPDASATFSPKASLISLHGFVPDGFEVGVEILNDNSTTMEFVVHALTKHLKLPHEKAIEMMLTIHKKGGLLIPLETYELAQEVSSEISNEAKREGHDLVCRPVDARRAHSADAKKQRD